MRNPVSRFAYTQSDVGIRRSTFDRNNRHLTTMSAGRLYPLLVDEVLPGDTYSIDMSSLLRMSTPIHPVMDNCYLDTYWFFVPNRIVWDHWKEFMGESPSDPYQNPIEYTIPGLIPPLLVNDDRIFEDECVAPKSLLDYMGIPTRTRPEWINALPVRGFCKIWNEWFRDQNLQNAIDVTTDDADRFYYTGADTYYDEYLDSFYNSDTSVGGALPPVSKYHDYFTSALKEPQKGDPVPIPLSGMAPVYASDLVNVSGLVLPETSTIPTNIYIPSDDVTGRFATNGSDDLTIDGADSVHFNNLGADLSRVAGIYATISDLRYAFQLQKFLEADNRGGVRYREILKQHFNVTSPDASQQIPEFLGGKRIPINIAQVLQTSSTDDTSPQGNTAAYSLTTDKYSAFTKSFTEHGFIFCVGCIRTEHTYQNGAEAMWFRRNKFDFYFPEFANISDQPIYNRELFLPEAIADDQAAVDLFKHRNALNDEVFGFKEAWSEYKYKPNRVSGIFRSNYPDGSLDSWHYADDYSSLPYLSDSWIPETDLNIGRTLAVQGDYSDQFICDFYFKMKTTRPMPVYSIPGLADHH